MIQVKTQSQSSFDNIKATVANIQKLNDPTIQKQQSDSNIAKQKSAVNDAQNAVKNANDDLSSLNNGLELTKKDYEAQIQQQQFTIANLTNTIEINKANLEYLKR
jgi:hypothetical protein